MPDTHAQIAQRYIWIVLFKTGTHTSGAVLKHHDLAWSWSPQVNFAARRHLVHVS